MRRSDIANAVARILTTIRESGVEDMLRKGMEAARPNRDSEINAWVSINVIANLAIEYSHYSEIERAIIEIMDIEFFFDNIYWQKMLHEPEPHLIYSAARNLNFVTENLPKIISLLDRNYERLVNKDSVNSGQPTSIQTVVLNDSKSGHSSPDRIINLVKSVNDVYEVICEILELNGTSLAIVGLDSGSEQSFDFLGLAKAMQELRLCFSGIYQAFSMRRLSPATQTLKLFEQTLPIIGEIDKLGRDGAIDNETCSRLKNKLLSAAEKFGQTGAYIPEVVELSSIGPTLIMTPEPKLLASPSNVEVEDSSLQTGGANVSDDDVLPPSNESAGALGDLTPDQVASLLEILKKNDQNNVTTPKLRRSRAKPKPKPKPKP